MLARRNGLDRARLGLAISAKRLTTAAARNAVKRLVRESFRQRQERLRGLDLVVLVQRSLDHGNRALMRDSIERHWEKLAERCASS